MLNAIQAYIPKSVSSTLGISKSVSYNPATFSCKYPLIFIHCTVGNTSELQHSRCMESPIVNSLVFKYGVTVMLGNSFPGKQMYVLWKELYR